jgi:hypothetical protein
MKPDEFEQQLQRLPRQPVPPEWRAEILELARATDAARVVHHEASTTQRPTRFPSWREWLWPCPQAWAGLAAVWMILLALQVTTPSKRSSIVRRSLSLDKQFVLAAQRRELERLLDVPTDPAPASKPAVPGPRSERISLPKV